MPAVVELGRSKEGPPVRVVMQPGVTVVPGSGLASYEEMVLAPVATVLVSGA